MLQLDENQVATLKTYEKHLDDYLATHQHYQQDILFWREKVLAITPKSAKILELGSGEGRDANYMEDKGYNVFRTDAVNSFIEFQSTLGHQISKLNVLIDPLSDIYDLIFANKVFMHFNDAQLEVIMKKLRAGLTEHGILAFTVKQGFGEEMTSHKLGAPRYFRYWQPEEIQNFLRACGYTQMMIDSLDNNQWIGIVCK